MRSQPSVIEPKFHSVVYRCETVAVNVAQHVLYLALRTGREEKANAALYSSYRRFQNKVSAAPESNVTIHTVL